jgi:site-specific recombinase XerD
MTDPNRLGPWVRRFLLEHVTDERNLSRNTQQSYRDALCQLLPFAARQTRKQVDRLTVTDLSADLVRLFLRDLEETRGCGISTRNQRLAAIHSLARFIGSRSPEHVAWCGEVREVPMKKSQGRLVTYLEKAEMDALLASPDVSTPQGRRDHAVLLFLYNSGARADEAAHVRVCDLQLGAKPESDPSSVLIRGKGNKLRRCPLWATTAGELAELIRGRPAEGRVFLNRRGEPLTRFGIHTLVERYAAKVTAEMPSLASKRVSPHTIRHTTATHLLRSGVDINTIRAWLGHASLATTNVYAEVDLEMKAKALANCEIEGDEPATPWREDGELMDFLRNL